MVTQSRSETLIGVYLLVPNRLVRESFVRVFRKRAGLTVVGENQDSDAAMEDLAEKPCDVLLLSSVAMLRTIAEGGNGAEPKATPRPLLFGMDENADTFLRAVRLGACGYLLNDASSSEVVAAIRAVASGEAVCPPKLCKRLFEHVSAEKTLRGAADAGLTCRQRQLMQLVAKGMTNKEIAINLKVSEFTVKNHLSRIMAQLRAESRHQAVDVMRAGGYPLNA
jgi:DNA-binding NarL/FixJ family response regulator